MTNASDKLLPLIEGDIERLIDDEDLNENLSIPENISLIVKKLVEQTYFKDPSHILESNFVHLTHCSEPFEPYENKMVVNFSKQSCQICTKEEFNPDHLDIDAYLIENFNKPYILITGLDRFEDATPEELEMLDEAKYWSDLTECFGNSVRLNIEWLMYELFKGSEGKSWTKKEWFEKYATRTHELACGCSKYHLATLVLKTSKDNPEGSLEACPIKRRIDDIRRKMESCKQTCSKGLETLKKELLDHGIEIKSNEDNNLIWYQLHNLRIEAEELISNMISNPSKYCINKFAGENKEKYDDYDYPIDDKDLIALYNPSLRRKYETTLNGLSCQIVDASWSFKSPRGQEIKRIESSILPENEILILHKNAIKLVVITTKINLICSNEEDYRNNRVEHTFGFMIGSVDYLPLQKLVL